MRDAQRLSIWLWPLAGGGMGTLALTALYFVLVSWAESPQHAWAFFWEERWLVLPLVVGCGVQVALYIVLKKRLFLPRMVAVMPSAPGAVTGASGATSTLAMVACCAHHVTDVLPVLGLTAAATFLAEYQTAFMGVGLLATWGGVVYMLWVLYRERRKVVQSIQMGLGETT